jgi:hypothetical protein
VTDMSLPHADEFVDSLNQSEQYSLAEASRQGRLGEVLIELLHAKGYEPSMWQLGDSDAQNEPPASYTHYIAEWLSETQS